MLFCALRKPQLESATLDFPYFLVIFEYFGTKNPVKRLRTAIFGVHRHVFGTIRLKRRKPEAAEALCENTFSRKLHKKTAVMNFF